MQFGTRFALALLLTTVQFSATSAEDAPAAKMPQELIPFSSDEGLIRLARASADLPRDRSRLREEDLRYVPKNYDPTIPRFTQDNLITKGQKTRAQVLGEPLTINGKQVSDYGYEIRQLDEMLRANGVDTKLTIVDDSKAEQDIRSELVENLKRRGDYVIVAFLREAVGERGGPHISPVGAYDAESDSFLVLDVNPANADWVWMPAKTLVNGMRTFDKIENRGYVLVQPN